VAGIRPARIGFREVTIAPQPGALRELRAVVAHPRGVVRAELAFEGNACRGECELPDGVTGALEWRGATTALKPGRQAVALPAGGNA
jgi:hypothetical protein